MGTKVAEAYVAIKASTEELGPGLKKAESETVAKASSISMNVSGILKTGLISILNNAKQAASNLATGLLGVGAALAGIAVTAESSGVRLNATLRGSKEAAGFSRQQLDAIASDIGAVSGASQRLVRESQAVLLSFGEIRGDRFKQIMEAVPDLAAALGKELPEATRIFAEAVRDPIKGLETLKSLGVTITAPMQEAFKLAAEGSNTGMRRAQNYVLQALKNISKGSMSEMDGTLAGAVARVKGGFMDMVDSFSPVLVPVAKAVSGLMTNIKDAVAANKPIFEAFGKAIGTAFDFVGLIVKGVINFIAMIPDPVKKAIAQFVGIGVVLAGISVVALKLFVFLKPILITLVAALSLLLSPLGLIIGAIALIGAAVVFAFSPSKWGGKIKEVLVQIIGYFQRLWEKIKEVAAVIWSKIQPAWDAFYKRASSAIQGVWKKIQDVVAALWSKVKPAWDAVFNKVSQIFDGIAKLFKDNEATFMKWSSLISEIFEGVVDFILKCWEPVVAFFEQMIDAVMSAWNTMFEFVTSGFESLSGGAGVTWEQIRDAVTLALDTMSALVADFNLTSTAAWLAVQYGAQVAWDKIKYGFQVAVAAIYGSVMYIVAACEAAWDNIKAAWERVVNSLRASFTAVAEAASAAFKGKNPAKAFREAYEREVAKLEGNSSKFKNVGEAAASAYKKGYDEVMGDVKEGESEEARRLRLELEATWDAMKKARDAKRAGRKDDESPGGESSPEKSGEPPQEVGNLIKVKFETVGLQDLWKTVQQTMTGNSTVQLQQRQVRAAEEGVRVGREQADLLRGIHGAVKEPKPAVAG